MRLTFIGTDSGGGHCPTLYATDRGTVVVQGTRVDDLDAVADLERSYGGLPAHESAVEIPAELLRNWGPMILEALQSQTKEGDESLTTAD
ncbi:hypothetical protein [Kutzneria sp. CA-103260]|uniref:hypothetical protein n=1 Tax=Kutzneria sp. CA-103260 TaxID=2802641 RepID=UPI001BF0DB13|nr:hypothetical protein [Kutzneria sp. CA-103260]QUQ68252.1 hypothetical protein JJ691_59970 [Kutzneria sp. CA-103260]